MLVRPIWFSLAIGDFKRHTETDALPNKTPVGVANRRAHRLSRDQRWAIGSTSRLTEPVKSWRGRPILYSGSLIISLSCAIQPTVRASAKTPVNMLTGCLLY